MGQSEGTIKAASAKTISFGSINTRLADLGVDTGTQTGEKKQKATVTDLLEAQAVGIKTSETQATSQSAQTALNNKDIAAFLNQMAFSAPLGQQIPQGPPPGLGGAAPSGGTGGGSSGSSKGTSGSKDSGEKTKETDSDKDDKDKEVKEDLNDDGRIDKEDAKLQKEADAKKKE